MKLFLTDCNFSLGGTSHPGIPFLCDNRMELVDAPNRYLRYVATVRGRSRAPATWRTYADHLFEFFSFLEANNLPWTSCGIEAMATWRNAMLARKCSRNTVNQRLRCVQAFYGWAQRQGLVQVLPFSTQDVTVARPPRFLSHLDVSGGRVQANELTLRTTETPPTFLRLGDAVRFLDALTPARVRLMGYLMLLTGMRRDEVVHLDYRALPNPAGQSPNSALPMVLDGVASPTKGSKRRTVMVPFDLAVALMEYLTFNRHPLQREYSRRNGSETTRLFLSQRGEELSPKSLNRAFTAASKRTSITCRPHVLRHTFGTYELLRMKRTHGEDRALLWVRERMGHSSISTTEIYIHAADLIQSDAVDGYQRDLCEALRHGHSPT